MFKPLQDDSTTIERVEQRACTTLESFPSTPLRRIEWGFQFIETDPSPGLLHLFRILDEATFLENGWKTNQRGIVVDMERFQRSMGIKARYEENRVEFSCELRRATTESSEMIDSIVGSLTKGRNDVEECLTKIFQVQIPNQEPGKRSWKDILLSRAKKARREV